MAEPETTAEITRVINESLDVNNINNSFHYEYTNYNDTAKFSIDVLNYTKTNYTTINDELILNIKIFMNVKKISDIENFILCEIDMQLDEPNSHLIRKLLYKDIKIPNNINNFVSSQIRYLQKTISSMNQLIEDNRLTIFGRIDEQFGLQINVIEGHTIKIFKLSNDVYQYQSIINYINIYTLDNFERLIHDSLVPKFARNVVLPVNSNFIVKCARLIDKYTSLNIDLNDLIISYTFDSYFEN
jgi:hypothetical protein